MKRIFNGVVVLLVALGAGSPMLASAQATSTPVGALSAKMTAQQKRADTEIGDRIAALNALLARIGQMQKLSSAEIASITASVQNEITQLSDLKNKIDADTDEATLKADLQSITKSYRIYALVMPQVHIAAMADRVETLVGMFEAESQKLAARISTASGDTSALQAALADLNAKVVDADTQAQAAVSESVNLVPDGGDQSVFKANNAALKAARTALQAAQQDLVAARKDMATILKGLRSEATTTAATTTSTQ